MIRCIMQTEFVVILNIPHLMSMELNRHVDVILAHIVMSNKEVAPTIYTRSCVSTAVGREVC